MELLARDDRCVFDSFDDEVEFQEQILPSATQNVSDVRVKSGGLEWDALQSIERFYGIGTRIK
jgi:hypothetical protein